MYLMQNTDYFGLGESSGATVGGEYIPRRFLFGEKMKELSIFIDESGDFGEFKGESPFYIVTLVFHNQSNDISEQISILDRRLSECDYQDKHIHTHPIIRREPPYHNLSVDERRKILNKILRFTMSCDIKYISIVVDKKEAPNRIKLSAKIANLLSDFIRSHLSYFQEYDRIIVYYDNGQQELSLIINTILNTAFSNVDFRNASPQDYKLLQVADFICSMELLKQKHDTKMLTKSESSFFYKPQELQKNYFKSIRKKRFTD